jgi:hypothetical protein
MIHPICTVDVKCSIEWNEIDFKVHKAEKANVIESILGCFPSS